MKQNTSYLAASVVAAGLTASAHPAVAWGDKGHEVVALVAQSYMDPGVRQKVNAMLASDTDSLTAHDIASEATWADKYRDANIDDSRMRTRQWHFVDIEITGPNLDQACFNHPAIPEGTPASNGPANDCVVDKIDEFAAELKDPNTSPEERVTALKFLLHFVGDVHQPLHASDNNDSGGNKERVTASGIKPGSLHHFWDDETVDALGPDAKSIVSDLIEHISDVEAQTWAKGTASDWAMDSFQVAKADAYGQLPDHTGKTYHLTEDYVAMGTQDASTQLSKAGVRLAFLLNNALGSAP